MSAIDRAIEAGDVGYIKAVDAYKRIEKGEINKEIALKELGSSFKNTIEIWCRHIEHKSMKDRKYDTRTASKGTGDHANGVSPAAKKMDKDHDR